VRAGDLFRTVLGSLRRAKLRLIMTSAGVMIGTASVVLMVAVGFGMERSITQQFEQYAIATDITVLSGQSMGHGTDGSEPVSDRDRPKLDDATVRTLEQIPAVKAVLPRLGVSAMMRYKTYMFGQQFYAVEMGLLEKWGMKLDSGRFPTGPNEVLAGYAVPVIMLAGDQAFMGNMDTGTQPRLDLLDKQVKIEFQGLVAGDGMQEPPPAVTKKLRVVGILKAADFSQDMVVYVPMKTAERYTGLDTRDLEYNEVTVRAKKVTDVEQLTKDITAMGFQAFSPGAQMNAASGVFRIIQLVLGAIGGIALLVASIGIANTMTMATYERTREIGIMKAVGASGKQVRALFLFEAAVIGLLGGVGGLLFAVTAAGLGNLLVASLGTAGQNPVTGGGGSLFYIPVPLALFAVTFSALVGLVAGTLPAVRAANLDPLAALRHE
jgi:putative ABC transport system permease protein